MFEQRDHRCFTVLLLHLFSLFSSLLTGSSPPLYFTLLSSPLLYSPLLYSTSPSLSTYHSTTFLLLPSSFILSFCVYLHLIYLHVPEIELVDPDRNLLIVPSEDTEADEDTEGKTGPPPADGI